MKERIEHGDIGFIKNYDIFSILYRVYPAIGEKKDEVHPWI